jgi:hypothetical protein
MMVLIITLMKLNIVFMCLFDNLKEDNTAKNKIEKKFREYNIIDNSGNCTYQIKNRGVVESFIKNFNNTALKYRI